MQGDEAAAAGAVAPVEGDKQMNKNELQRTIKAIRGDDRTYPKAMMTTKQSANNTATINCGGSPHADTLYVAEVVANHDAFIELMDKYGAEYVIQMAGTASRPFYQVRITWAGE